MLELTSAGDGTSQCILKGMTSAWKKRVESKIKPRSFAERVGKIGVGKEKE